MNDVTLIGNLGADPELKHTTNGNACLRMRLATSESYKDQSGQKQERTEWHTVILWGNRAEALGKFLAKGHKLGIKGSIHTRQWDDKEGRKRWSTEIKARDIEILGSPRQTQRDGDGFAEGMSQGRSQQQVWDEPEIDESELPF